MIGVFTGEGKVADLIVATLEPLAAESRFHAGILKLRNITAKLDLETWLGPEFEPIEIRNDSLQNHQTRLPLRFRVFFRRFVIIALDHLTGGGDANATKNSIRLAEVDLIRRKINVGIQLF